MEIFKNLFFKPICVIAFLLLAILAQTETYNQSTSAGATGVSDEVTLVSQALVGKRITIHGKFSLLGKVGPFISLGNHQLVYLESKRSFTWGKPYSGMEGKLVTATGILRFYHAPPAQPTDQAVQHVPDYYYFEIETTQVRLIGH